MNEVISFLKTNKDVDFATVDQNGRARVRPLEVLPQDDGKLWFATSKQKNVFKELCANPYVEFTVTSADSVWLRVSGKAAEITDKKVKQALIERNEFLKGLYKTGDHPDFALISIEEATATFYSFTAPPREVKM